MSRFFVPEQCVKEGRVILRGDELHHARDVMRLKPGDGITVFNGSGKQYHGIIETTAREEMIIKINKIEKMDEHGCRITLIQAIPKSNRMDLIIEKATELGIYKIVPVVTERTIVRIGSGKENGKVNRWKKIAVIASKQCGRTTLPEISNVTDFYNAADLAKTSGLAVIPCLERDTLNLKDALRGKKIDSAVLFIGPEGDFTRNEIDRAVSCGAIPVSLGREILRSETAAIAGLSVLNYMLRW